MKIPRHENVVAKKVDGGKSVIENLEEALSRATALMKDPALIRRVVLSGRQRAHVPPFVRIDIRPVELKGVVHLQVVSHDGKQDFTRNLLPDQVLLADFVESGYGNIVVENQETELSIRITKSGAAQVSIKATKKERANSSNLSHDRRKRRLLSEDDAIFIELGISDNSGKLKPSRTDKFLQVNEFLKIIDHLLGQEWKSEEEIAMIDLGCGSAYLTFAAHHYLKQRGFSVTTVGVDTRDDSRAKNTEISQRSGFSDEMTFVAAEISAYPKQKTDIAIALHACDTATDDALAWAVKNESTIILVAPCCQHDIQRQLSNIPHPFGVVTKHGILKERVGDILTDAIRAQVLRILGYRTEVIEFIAGEHTPRNLMIRAVLTGAPAQQKDFGELDSLIEQWGISPVLMKQLEFEIEAQRHRALS